MKSKIINDVEKEKKELRSTIICVDDEKMMLSILYEQLTEWFGKSYKIEKALSGEEALEIMDRCLEEGETISVVISDYVMPIMKGDELLIEVRKRDPRIRKIMLTGYTSVSGIITAINQAGLYRFIPKPWDQKDLMLTIMEAIKSFEQDKKMQDLAKGFESLYRRHNESAKHTVDAILSTMQVVNSELVTHAIRVKQYAYWLSNRLGLDEVTVKNIKYAALLHDIGKIGMHNHKETLTYQNNLMEDKDEALRQIDEAKKIISHLDEPALILRGVVYQFEKYDGSGPYKMEGDEIPKEARIMSIIHYYDLLSEEDSNGQVLTVTKIVEKLCEKKGTWFDPIYVDEFIKTLVSQKIEKNL